MRHASLNFIDHRPWPLPAEEWRWRQIWVDLAFLHFRVDAAALRSRIPPGLQLDEFDDAAWVSVVPFRMEDVAPRGLPSVGPMRSFPELNVRTYVSDGAKPGVFFFSLDADCLPIVIGGRVLYGLPYFRARMSLLAEESGWRNFRSERRSGGHRFEARYRPSGSGFTATRGSLEHWLTERYCLYSSHRGRLLRLDVHHRPWPLQEAVVEVARCDVLAAAGIEVRNEPPVCHFSTGVEVVSYSPGTP